MLTVDQKSLKRKSLARNEVLFRQGDKVSAIYFVETGRLRLERRTFDGRPLILGTTPAGEFFVEAALFADTYHCDAVATEPSRVRVYPKATVLKALRADATNAVSFLALMARQVMGLRQRLELMKVRSAQARVMLYLDLHADPDSQTVQLRSELQDIASELGLSREDLYRAFARLEVTLIRMALGPFSGFRPAGRFWKGGRHANPTIHFCRRHSHAAGRFAGAEGAL